MSTTHTNQIVSHRFLDEAGDTTFWGKGKIPILGNNGVSLSFAIGMVKINTPLDTVRKQVLNLQHDIENNDYLNGIPSVRKKIDKGGYYFHACDDPPEIRSIFYQYIKTLDCSLEMVVARKIPQIFASKHHCKDSELYADVLSHLIKNKLKMGVKLVLNIASRGNCTNNANLTRALESAFGRALKKHEAADMTTSVVFNVQNQQTEPILNIADYMCWSVQRVFERGETRYYDYLVDQVSLVVDIYDFQKLKGSKNYYRRDNRLTEANKLSPPTS